MISRTASRAVAAVLLLEGASGCSWAFMHAPPPAPVEAPAYPVECTASTAAPVVDVLFSAAAVGTAVAAASAKGCSDAAAGEACVSSDTKTFRLLVSVTTAALYATSAGRGFSMSRRCENVKRLNAFCIYGNETACKQLNPAWKPPPTWTPGIGWTTATKIPAAAPGPAAAPSAGCTKDVDCKGTRICERGVCVEPPAKPAP